MYYNPNDITHVALFIVDELVTAFNSVDFEKPDELLELNLQLQHLRAKLITVQNYYAITLDIGYI